MRRFAFTIVLVFCSTLIGKGFPGSSYFSIESNLEKTMSHENNRADSLEHRIINGIDHSYGYDILIHGRLVIHQPSVPCQSGNRGFEKKSDARKVAMLVMEKIRKGIMPPTVTLEDLKSLGVVD